MSSRSAFRRTALSLITTSAVLLAAACGGAANGKDDGGGTPKQGGDLVYLEAQAYTDLYPPSAGFYPNGGIVNNITDRLVHQNPETLELEPWIATDWEINDTATEYTFHLRDDVTFSDGTKLDAAAVAKNFDLFGKGDPARGLQVSEAVNNYDRSEVIDPLTVKFYFTAPSPGFLQATSTINSGLLSPATLDGDFQSFAAGNGTKIIGSGPFVVESEKLGSEVVLKAREDYAWGPESDANPKRPYVDSVTYTVTPEGGVRVGSLASKQADVARQINATDEKLVTNAGGSIEAPQTRGVNNSYSLRFSTGPLADINVRKALLIGTDRQEIVDTLFTDNYPLATSVLSAEAGGYVDLSDKLPYDVDQAVKLLEDAGWKVGADGIREKDGVKLSFTVNEAKPQPRSFDVDTLIAQQWKKDLGVDLQILRADSGTYAQAIKDPTQVQIYHSMVGRADLDVIKSQYYSTNRNTLLNRGPDGSISDPELEKLLLDVASTVDPKARIAADQKVQEYLIDQAYVIPLFEEPQVFGIAASTHGVEFESVGRPDFSNTWITR
ncbi:TIGR04028 family ABC transporter substrate-binding protein [Blastococcus sp. Marseille-P5729]|uniref:TIGR04028 family ABC transporter substrate-binding protein n=1 Tax=Blastococcus sp. Marseille-P5729 TaxID=2086582 RepID=UPI000D10DF74|nr:TIGR04028 family ABC transporter substrate-binding protein [Blastococcus sp. Marseille-P5729]